jgi:hypothetical protein
MDPGLSNGEKSNSIEKEPIHWDQPVENEGKEVRAAPKGWGQDTGPPAARAS